MTRRKGAAAPTGEPPHRLCAGQLALAGSSGTNCMATPFMQ